MELSPSAPHDPFQRHVGSNQRVKRIRVPEGEAGEGEGGLLPKICGPTGNTRTLLVTSRCDAPGVYRSAMPAESLYISYDTKTSHYFPLSLDRDAQPLPPSSCSSPPRSARGHVTTIMLPPPLSRSLLRSSSRPPSQPPSFLASCSLPTPPSGYLLPRITYPLNESKRKPRLPPIAPPAN